MSRVNWEELLALFAEAWRRTGISPEIWCGENGYSWGSAKRHITIKAAKKHLEEKGENSPKQTAKKAANSQKKTANKTANSQVAKQVKKTSASDKRESISEPVKLIERDVETDFEPAEFGLSEQQAKFAKEVLSGKSLVESYHLAGYLGEGNVAYVTASQLLRNPKVSRAIRYLRSRRKKRYTAELDEIVHQLVAITRADPNAISQYRRVNCRYCWGERHQYQWLDLDEQLKAEKKAEVDSKPPPDLSGGIGFISNMDPNPDCPRCNGEGEGQILMGDTRDLDVNEHAYFLGVKQTKNGIEAVTESKQAARAMLVKIIQGENAASRSGDKPPANQYGPDDYRAAASSIDDEFGDLD